MRSDFYIHVLGSNETDDPFEDPDKFVSSQMTEQWEQFLNKGVTRDPPQEEGFYMVRWLPRKDGKAYECGVAEARAAKNDKKRFVWVDEKLRKYEMSRSTYPLPFFPFFIK